ncbi:MAG: hypothetical protein K1060chlam2_00035 [Chlamydiae bacterium]|nr:hypothetical protein [Chlamydiota bacterium]
MKKILYFSVINFLLLSFRLYGSHYELSICAIFKNEAPYLKEWIEFHKLQGVEHFFLYNNNSSDDYLTVLQPYIDSSDVTLIQWSYNYSFNQSKVWLSIQSGAYMDCVHLYGDRTTWLAAIDIDEFLFCTDGLSVSTFLEEYKDYGGVCPYWRLFGTSNLETIPSNLLMIEALIQCCIPEEFRNRYVKSIVQPRHVKSCASAHIFSYKDGYFAIDPNGNEITRQTGPYWTDDKLRINHYWTRSKEYFRTRKIPSRHRRRRAETVKVLWKMANAYNACIDTSILQFAPALREKMGYDLMPNFSEIDTPSD